jgi:endonuclease/exonuclease/phosphatase family metal-dependent hydrolase
LAYATGYNSERGIANLICEKRLQKMGSMKIIFNTLIILLFLLSLGLNIWQADITHPLPPAMGTALNSEMELKDNPQTSLRIATYNIRGGKGFDGKRDIKRTAGMLEGFDIIALNEVLGKSFLLGPNQAEVLGKILDMGWLFLPNQKQYYSESFGNGFLSSFDINSWHQEPLIYQTHTSRSRHYRNLATIEFFFNGKVVNLLLTHLDRGPARDAQLAYVLSKFKQYDYGILLGDLNTLQDDPQLMALLEDGKAIDVTNVLLGATDFMRFDYIIVKGFSVIDGGFKPPGVSDHALLWAELKLQ